MTELAALTLVVTNSEKLDVGLKATHRFSTAGGSIGSNPNNDWVLRDLKQQVEPIHCQIAFFDDHFIVEDRCNRTLINGSDMPIGLGKRALLEENDLLQIGPYSVRVHMQANSELVESSLGSLEEDVMPETALLDWVSTIGQDEGVVKKPDEVVNEDPLAALTENASADDEFRALSVQPIANHDALLSDDNIKNTRQAMAKADSEYEMSSAMTLKKQTSREAGILDDHTLALLEKELSQDYLNNATLSQSVAANQHVAASPLFKGLRTQIGDTNNLTQMQALSEEMGASLRVAIEGLLAINQQVENSRYGVMNKNLQPIEDNPLRLGLGYQETMQVLYTNQRSPVHLSAPAAIEESLTMIKNHDQIVQGAIEEALDQILRAFSPEVLISRFMRYRRPEQDRIEADDAWAWRMYQSYYQELTSGRQHGFEKLFWEIFDQAYDRLLRKKHREE